MNKKCSLISALFNLGQVVRERLKLYLNHFLFKSFHCIIDNLIICGLDYRINHPTFIIDIARSGDVLYNDQMRSLFNRLAYTYYKRL